MSPAGRREVFGSLCLAVFAVNFGRIVFAPLLTAFESAFVVSEATLGVLTTLVWLGSALPRVPAGYLLTRTSRVRVVAGTGLVLAGAAAVTASATSVPVLLLGGFLVGTSSGVYFIAANPLVSELFPDRVGSAVGVHGTASQLAAVLAPLAVGPVLAVADWRAVFWGLAAVAVAATLGLLAATRGADLPVAGAADRDLLAAARAQRRVILVSVLLLGVSGFVWNAVFNFYVKYLVATKPLAEPAARTMLTVAFAAGVPAFALTGRLADRVDPLALLLGLLAAFTCSVLALTAVTGALGVAVVSAVMGYVIHSTFPAVDTYLLSTLPDRHRGSAYAVYSGGMMVVAALGGVTLGSLRAAGVAYDTAFGWFAVVLGVLVAGLAVAYWTGRLAGTRARDGSAQ